MSVERIEVGGLTLEDLESAIRDAGFTGDASDEGKTTEELSQAWKCSIGSAMKMIKQAGAMNILRVGKRVTRRIDGGKCRVPVYSFDLPKKAVKKK